MSFNWYIPAHAITCIMTFTQITLYFSKSVHNSFEQINVNELIFAVMNCFNITRAGFAISKINATVIYRCSTNILTVNQLTVIRYCYLVLILLNISNVLWNCIIDTVYKVNYSYYVVVSDIISISYWVCVAEPVIFYVFCVFCLLLDFFHVIAF